MSIFKPFLDNKMSIFEEYGAFKIVIYEPDKGKSASYVNKPYEKRVSVNQISLLILSLIKAFTTNFNMLQNSMFTMFMKQVMKTLTRLCK